VTGAILGGLAVIIGFIAFMTWLFRDAMKTKQKGD
jgi:flagellar biogenesis protein FliO